MKKKTISLILALILLLSCSATAQATSVQAATPSASITINGTTATCRVSIAKPGKTIHATLQLWQGRTMIDSWSGNGTSYLLITGSHEVTKGKTYTVKIVLHPEQKMIHQLCIFIIVTESAITSEQEPLVDPHKTDR